MASYLPEKFEVNDAKSRLTKKTGILKRHIADRNECASDLALKAAENLLISSQFEREKIDFIILCTQSPDYFLPTTACILQDKLGLGKHCGAFDFNLGCSGYVYGLAIVKGLIETGQAESVLFLTAETYSKYIKKDDQVVKPLFGDGAVATLVCAEESETEGIYATHFGTDGHGAKDLIVSAGASRNPFFAKDQQQQVDSNRDGVYLSMNGSQITQFALDVVPETVDRILRKAHLTKKEIDCYVFHQANQFMLAYLQDKCALNAYPYWNNSANYGNTVSSSIPLALIDMMKTMDADNLNKVMLVGFGVGLSWSGCIVDLSKILRCNKILGSLDY